MGSSPRFSVANRGKTGVLRWCFPYCKTVSKAKSLQCSCCGHRVLERFTTEASDDGLLSWFAGDVLYADCIRAGYWV